MGVDAGGGTRALRTYLCIDAVGLQLFGSQLLQIVIQAHTHESCIKRLEIALAGVLFYSGLGAVGVTAEAKHQLHHLIECAIAVR